MRIIVFCTFLAACGGASAQTASTQSVTLTPAPQLSASVAPVVTATASTPTTPPLTIGTIRFEGGDGSDTKHAIVIRGAKGESDGVAAEYTYLEHQYGARGVGFKMGAQALMQDGGHSFDRLDVMLKDGKNLSVFFDITEYFGKF